MIKRNFPEGEFIQPLNDVYNLLLLGQGFTPDEFHNVALAVREAILDKVPYFGAFKRAPTGCPFVVHAENLNNPSDDLGIQQKPSGELFIDTLDAKKLQVYLGRNTRIASGDGTEVSAADIWTKGGRSGRGGSLVAVLKNKGSAGELYELVSSPNYPVPLVAVTVTDQYWEWLRTPDHNPKDWPAWNVLIRAVGQTFGGLGDEYEFDGDEYEKVPDGVWIPPPNIIYVDDGQHNALLAIQRGQSQTLPQDRVPAVKRWIVTVSTKVRLSIKDPAGGQATPAGMKGNINLVEGAGYRNNAMRCDLDCLMRRVPMRFRRTIRVLGTSWSGGTVTLAVESNPADAGISPGIRVSVADMSPSAYNGNFNTVTVSATSISYTLDTDPGGVDVRGTVRSDPIQDASIGFCAACAETLRVAVWCIKDAKLQGRVHLASQRLLFDDENITWSSKPPPQGVAQRVFAPVVQKTDTPTPTPTWQYTPGINDTSGLTISDVKLLHRDMLDHQEKPFFRADPFFMAENILKSIQFENMRIKFSEPSPTGGTVDRDVRLDNSAAGEINYVQQALADAVNPPQLYFAEEGGQTYFGPKRYKLGVKLKLSCNVEDKLLVNIGMSLVLAGVTHNGDPYGAVTACKIFPQLSMSYRWLNGKGKGRQVELLTGTIVLVANNVIPSAAMGGSDAMGMVPDKLDLSFFADTNQSDWDNEYTFSGVYLPRPLNYLLDLAPNPSYGLHDGTWQHGRKLARIAPVIGPTTTTDADQARVGAGTARYGHIFYGGLILIHWSWLFDYTRALTPDPTHFTAVYGVGDEGADGANALTPRSDVINWPAPPFEMTVRKVARQGAYDNLHIVASMGQDSKERALAPAPVCADMCLHLHWRWGTMGTNVARYPEHFIGWGNGRVDQGARTTRGAPLIPPNQHLEITAEKIPMDGADTVKLQYAVRANQPEEKQEQVFLEQGAFFGFSYAGLDVSDMVNLMLGTGALTVNLLTPDPLTGGYRAKGHAQFLSDKRNEDRFDMSVRQLFKRFYERIRWFDREVDASEVTQVPDTVLNPTLRNQLETL
jgi:hypothetical protein